MNKRRLLKLAKLLEADAKKPKGVKFDLETWGQTEKAHQFVKADCGTQACAVGLACVSGSFKNEGLRFGLDDKGLIYPEVDNPGFSGLFYEPRSITGEEAVKHFFDLTKREARFLFFPQKYPKTKTRGQVGELYVAKRIRDFVAGTVVP